jgi:ribosome-binding protein aMBF1 (putative translation factor)
MRRSKISKIIPNYSLKATILTRRIKQYSLARELDTSESIVSRIVTGHIAPTRDERRKLAAVLGVSEQKLFAAWERHRR